MYPNSPNKNSISPVVHNYVQNQNQYHPRNHNIIVNGTNVNRPESAHRSNSSSRVISQNSRVEYLNVGGDSIVPRLNTERVNIVGPAPMPQAYMTGDKKVFMPINARPPSNISNQSSISRNSVE